MPILTPEERAGLRAGNLTDIELARIRKRVREWKITPEYLAEAIARRAAEIGASVPDFLAQVLPA